MLSYICYIKLFSRFLQYERLFSFFCHLCDHVFFIRGTFFFNSSQKKTKSNIISHFWMMGKIVRFCKLCKKRRLCLKKRSVFKSKERGHAPLFALKYHLLYRRLFGVLWSYEIKVTFKSGYFKVTPFVKRGKCAGIDR